MIINKGYEPHTVVSFRLISGEELIARVTEDTDTHFKLLKPVNLIATGNGGLGMAPAMFSADLNTSSIVLQKSAVVMHTPSRKEIADEYIKATTSIKPASALVGALGGKSSSS